MMANRIATVILKGHCVKTGDSPRLSLRNVNPCDKPARMVATIPRTIRLVPNRMAPSCNRTLSGVGDVCCKERKNPTIPKPNVAIVRVVLIQASVVRSSASFVRKLAMLVRRPAKLTRGSLESGDSCLVGLFASFPDIRLEPIKLICGSAQAIVLSKSIAEHCRKVTRFPIDDASRGPASDSRGIDGTVLASRKGSRILGIMRGCASRRIWPCWELRQRNDCEKGLPPRIP